MDDSFLTGTNATFVAEMYQRWKKTPNSVSSDWSDWFTSLDELSSEHFEEISPSWGKPKSKVIGANYVLKQTSERVQMIQTLP